MKTWQPVSMTRMSSGIPFVGAYEPPKLAAMPRRVKAPKPPRVGLCAVCGARFEITRRGAMPKSCPEHRGDHGQKCRDAKRKLYEAAGTPDEATGLPSVSAEALRVEMTRLLPRIAAGERMVVTKRNRPVAVLAPVGEMRRDPVAGVETVIHFRGSVKFFDTTGRMFEGDTEAEARAAAKAG